MSVALDPEVVEFIPKDFLETITNGVYTMNRAAKLSNTMPIGVAYKKFQSFPDFNVVAKQLNNNVVCQLNSIFKTEIPSYNLKEDDVQHNIERIIDANDLILDRISHKIDCYNKGMKSSDLPPRDQAPSVIGVPFNAPIVTKIQMGSATFTGAKIVMRPQIMFKDPVDNTATAWSPKIKEKPNNITPLALVAQYDKDGDIIGYEHPYEFELSQFQLLPQWLIPDTEELAFPRPLSETNYTYINTVEEVNELVNHLQTVEELAIDLEHHSYRSYQGFTCLMQLSTKAGDFIIDALATREHLHKLNLIFTNPKILKIFHGADNDVIWLQRDFGVYVVGMFDTHQAARLLRHSSKSLSALLKRYCNIEADKTYQLADWRLRPLTEDMVKYARIDTHYLPYVWRRMRIDLLNLKGGRPDMLVAAFESSRQVCALTYRKPVVTKESHLNLYCRYKKSFNYRQITALRMLYKWRDDHARVHDDSTVYLLPNHMLMSLAERLPRDIQGVTAICNPMPLFVKQNVVNIHKILLSCRELPIEYPVNNAVPLVPYVKLPPPENNVHDMEVNAIKKEASKDQAGSALAESKPVDPLNCQQNDAKGNVVENLNPDLKVYSKEQTNQEDIKDYKEREAKIKALAEGNELIKTEVLLKMQAATPQGPHGQGTSAAGVGAPAGNEAPTNSASGRDTVNIGNMTHINHKPTKRGIDVVITDRGGNSPPKVMRRYHYDTSNYNKYHYVKKNNK